jgi:myosin protein heavy chain
MAPLQLDGPSRRANPFNRNSASPSPGPQPAPSRPQSAVFTSPTTPAETMGHTRNLSFSPLNSVAHIPSNSRQRSNSARNNLRSSGTFAPQFIKSEELQRGADQIRGIEGENDFSGKRYVWLRDPEKTFVRGLVVEERDSGYLLIQLEDGTVRIPIRFVIILVLLILRL